MRNLQLPTFDLSKVVERVKSEHPDWSKDRLDNAAVEYRQFLAISKTSEGHGLIPSKDADEIWHAHIIHTIDYVRDCQAYFGYYLHHVPTGDNSVEDVRRCDELYKASFGRGILGPNASKCDGGCSACSDCSSITKGESAGFFSRIHV